jgi:nitrite reductase/ring-hydroxylating ferredoxin subunit
MLPHSTDFGEDEHVSIPMTAESTESCLSKGKKIVSFDKEVVARRHLHRNDFTDEEIRLTWHSHDEDLAATRAECTHTIKLMKAGECRDGDYIFCSRGLEYRTPGGARLRQQHKFAAWDAVEAEQQRQWEAGLFDEEVLAQVYIAYSDRCARIAHVIAINDEEFVRNQENVPRKKTLVSTFSRIKPQSGGMAFSVIRTNIGHAA